MTENKKIILNVLATFGRSIYALIVGLLAGRWTLMALGEINYGLIGVVGGLVALVEMLNNLLSSSFSRFLAFSVGVSRKDPDIGLEECRAWFSTGVFVHTVVPLFLMLVGYPLGIYMINDFLTVPPEKIGQCVWVWRFVTFSCFVSMINVPFRALYTANQEIAELTIYSFLTITANVIFLYYMILHPGDWLVRYSAWTCLIAVAPQIIISFRAFYKFPECRIAANYMFSINRLKELMVFACSRFLNVFSYMSFVHGSTIMVNKMLGPAKNAAFTIGNTVANHCLALSGSLTSAFGPAITNAAGEKDFARMRKFIYYTCSFSTAALLVFALPCLIESKEVVRLWLKAPPESSHLVCCAMLAASFIELISSGFAIGILAVGRIFKFTIVQCGAFFASLPIAYFFIRRGFGVLGVAITFAISQFLALVVKAYFAKEICGISISWWLRRIVAPLGISSMLSLSIGMIPRIYMNGGICRVVVTTLVTEFVLLPLLWILVLSDDEKRYIVFKVHRIIISVAPATNRVDSPMVQRPKNL